MMRDMSARERIVRPAVALVGLAFLALGAAVLIRAGVGVDPFTALNSGIAAALGTSIGNAQLGVNLVLLIAVLAGGPRTLGIGSVLNLVLTGYMIGGWAAVLAPLLPGPPPLPVQGALLVVGFALFALGVSVYVSAGIGAGPYDALAPMIVERTGWAYRWVRGAQDVLAVLIGWVLGGEVGAATAVTALATGPAVQALSERAVGPLVERLAGARDRA